MLAKGVKGGLRAPPEEDAMKRAAILVAGALLSSMGCKGNSDCGPGSPDRCANNAVEVCTENWFQAGDWFYIPMEKCQSPQVCRVYTAGANVDVDGATGC